MNKSEIINLIKKLKKTSGKFLYLKDEFFFIGLEDYDDVLIIGNLKSKTATIEVNEIDKPTIKIKDKNEIKKIQDSESSLSEILKVHMREPFSDSDIKFIDTHFERFGKKGCEINSINLKNANF